MKVLREIRSGEVQCFLEKALEAKSRASCPVIRGVSLEYLHQFGTGDPWVGYSKGRHCKQSKVSTRV